MAVTDFMRGLRPRSGRLPVLRRHGVAAPTRAAVARGLTLAGPVVCLAAVVVTATGAPGEEAFGRALFELLIVGVPMAAGIYALRAGTDARFALALIAFSLAWSLTALAETPASVPYTIGRLATWLVPPCVYYLLLVFPEGRLTARLDRRLFALIVALALLLFFGSAFFVESYPVHTPWATCDTDCPANALFLLHREPAVMRDVVIPLREWALCAVLVALVVSMVRRSRAASPLRRRTMRPVVATGIATAVCQVAFYATRQAGAPASVVQALGAAWGLCIVGVSGAFVFALFRRRLLLADVLARVSGTVRGANGSARLREALAGALGDPSVELVTRDEGSRCGRDSAGREVAWPVGAGPGRAVTVVGARAAGPAVAVVHDRGLCDDEELLTAVATLILAHRRHEEVVARLGAAMVDLAQSQRRVAETADVERARLERDLHDGVQQRLIALRIRLSLAEETLHEDPTAAAEAVHALGIEAERALDDLRTHARGVFASTLEREGLEEALTGLARDAPIPVHLRAVALTRRAPDVEQAVYFVCVEAIQNAMKHARGATGVWIDLVDDGALRFEVRDDGPGFVLDAQPHRGLRNMRDRTEAVGGRLTIQSRPGRGTRIVGVVEPVPAAMDGAAVMPAALADGAPEVRAVALAGSRGEHRGDGPGRHDGRLAERRVYERLLPADAVSITRMRRELDDALATAGLAADRLSDVALTLTEAATNVVVHAYPEEPPGALYATAAVRGATLVLSVIDCGRGTTARPGGPGAGMGMTLMTLLTDDLRIESGGAEGGTGVHVTFDRVIGPALAEPARAPAVGADVVEEYVRAVSRSPAGPPLRLTHAEAERTLDRVRRRRELARAA